MTRTPIVLGEQTIAVLTLFRRTDYIDDLWAIDWIMAETRDRHQKSAQQFIDALEGSWSPAFLMSLREKITNKLAEHDQKYGTRFADTDNAQSTAQERK